MAGNQKIEIISSFLPKQLNEETRKICEDAIKSVSASSIKDMGKVMGLKKDYSDVWIFQKPANIKENLK